MQIPDGLGNEEVKIGELSIVVSGRDIEEGFSSVKVKMNSITL